MAEEVWDTEEKIAAAMEGFAARMPGWIPPAAYGVVLVPETKLGTSEVVFPVVNVGVHGLPAQVLGMVTGRRSDSSTHELSPQQLRECIAMLAPAEAARMYRHPNLLSWREIASRLDEGENGGVFAVFVADLEDAVTSPYDEALRRQIEAGERSELYA